MQTPEGSTTLRDDSLWNPSVAPRAIVARKQNIVRTDRHVEAGEYMHLAVGDAEIKSDHRTCFKRTGDYHTCCIVRRAELQIYKSAPAEKQIGMMEALIRICKAKDDAQRIAQKTPA